MFLLLTRYHYWSDNIRDVHFLIGISWDLDVSGAGRWPMSLWMMVGEIVLNGPNFSLTVRCFLDFGTTKMRF